MKQTIRCAAAFFVLSVFAGIIHADPIFVRFKIAGLEGENYSVATGAFIHVANWRLTGEKVDAVSGEWSKWIDLSDWKLHGRQNRSGGVAEWPAMELTATPLGTSKREAAKTGVAFEVQLADKADEASVVISFKESSGSNTIAFLLPHPLRVHKNEFETGSQMAARHEAWAREATGNKPRKLESFNLITSLWGHYDPVLARQEIETLKMLGFNVVGGAPWTVQRDGGVKTYTATWHLMADPEESESSWKKADGPAIERELKTEQGQWTYKNMAHYVVSDEIQTLDFRKVDKTKLNAWFRDYLRNKGETDASMGVAIDTIEFPAEAMYAKHLPRDADLPTRKVMYYAGKWGQWWSVQRLRQTTGLVKQSLPGMKTETLPSDHNFFNAWGAPNCGMGYRGLDFFEIGNREAVDIVSAEDWLGLNHMYGPHTTWTGAQSFEYLSAILRSGVGDRNVALRGLITVSDDDYLRLKAYSAIGQGAKSFFFWTYGPTYIGTENYWSDLRSEYDGIAKLSAALEKSEKVLASAKVVRDPVAVLYSVSNDLWHTDDPACFVETRLTWHALRHLHVQPDFLREEDAEDGRLKDYKVVYFCGECLTRKAAAALDAWVRAGGVLYLSAGAACRDEFYEPTIPTFAEALYPADAASHLVKETGHAYNERTDLPNIKPLTTAKVALGKDEPFEVRVIGYRFDRKPDAPRVGPLNATFADGRVAGGESSRGKGRVISLGFMPGLAYSPFKTGQMTLDEVWPAAIRRIFAEPLLEAGVTPVVQASAPVVETSLLRGPEGSALVLVNYTYQPIRNLTVTIDPTRWGVDRTTLGDLRATSTEGVEVKTSVAPDGRLVLKLPLTWTDIILIK